MFRFFVTPEQITGDRVVVTGEDVNHMKNVLRMKPGEKVRISSGSDEDYFCTIEAFDEGQVMLRVDSRETSSIELPVQIYLFQGLPKSDKMELIIQKAVELGAYAVVPVAMKRSVVKLDAKKAQAKVKRWNAIAESAAKQSGRMVIPQVQLPVTFEKALVQAADMEYCLLPYENEEGMEGVRSILSDLAKAVKRRREEGAAQAAGTELKMQSPAGAELKPQLPAGTELKPHEPIRIGILIGPEGGFDPGEVELAEQKGWKRISLGRRILRTETAGMALLSVLVYLLEP
ncbi:MAG: 16S rRNA (uracil(1498)-N(3))-methyltransferase [Lachnospiraceae bacterium]|nr:16S rRNA (uracil(1498)-N(3))-methyltransferase [Lachnospiraceae bacterium]